MVHSAFSVHMLNEEGIKKATVLAEKFSDVLDHVETSSPGAGREVALARTALQEACFWAKRAMAMDPANQKKE